MPWGGLAAGTDTGVVDLWPTASAVQRGGPAPSHLQALGPVFALLLLASSGIAAGTDTSTVDLWPDAVALQRGGLAPNHLQASSEGVYALLALPGDGIAAGTGSWAVNLWPAVAPPVVASASDSAMQRRLTAPFSSSQGTQMKASGPVYSASALLDGRVAVGTVVDGGLVEVWDPGSVLLRWSFGGWNCRCHLGR